jgi:hypothetical protein
MDSGLDRDTLEKIGNITTARRLVSPRFELVLATALLAQFGLALAGTREREARILSSATTRSLSLGRAPSLDSPAASTLSMRDSWGGASIKLATCPV